MGVGAIKRNDRQTGRRLKAAPAMEPTRRNVPSRAEALERLTGQQGVLTVYRQELARIRRKTSAPQLKKQSLLKQVRVLQARPTSPAKTSQR